MTDNDRDKSPFPDFPDKSDYNDVGKRSDVGVTPETDKLPPPPADDDD